MLGRTGTSMLFGGEILVLRQGRYNKCGSIRLADSGTDKNTETYAQQRDSEDAAHRNGYVLSNRRQSNKQQCLFGNDQLVRVRSSVDRFHS